MKVCADGFAVKQHPTLDAISLIVHPFSGEPIEVEIPLEDLSELRALLEISHEEIEDEFLRAIEEIP